MKATAIKCHLGYSSHLGLPHKTPYCRSSGEVLASYDQAIPTEIKGLISTTLNTPQPLTNFGKVAEPRS